jgi:hypothetical protein
MNENENTHDCICPPIQIHLHNNIAFVGSNAILLHPACHWFLLRGVHVAFPVCLDGITDFRPLVMVFIVVCAQPESSFTYLMAVGLAARLFLIDTVSNGS